MRACAAKKIRVAVVISAGFAELGVDSEGARLQKQVVEIASRNGIRVVGPNVLGVLRPSVGLNASFAPSAPPSGGIAFVTQSGALADSEIDVALRERHAFSAIVSLGNQGDLDASDFLEWLARDAETKSIAVYLEGLRAGEGRKFLRAAREAAKRKPVIVLKGGRSDEGARAVSSHTAVLAGSPKVFDSVLAQAGCIRAEGFEDLFDLANALAVQPRAKENAVAVVTNGGGAGVAMWAKAVLGNIGGTPTFMGIADWTDTGAPGPGDQLGEYGVNTTANRVWAVVNHNSQFAVVPEPATMALIALGALGLLARRRSRSA
jgi:acetyltransferase